jgi:hypothetical protein
MFSFCSLFGETNRMNWGISFPHAIALPARTSAAAAAGTEMNSRPLLL